ncbi:MAG: DNA gyrase subunit A, partial [Candidatus Electryoneaceae bacterium]|nr:DNA gyrase subunit A [Candidatus Electryoneaceae bacterium]
MNIIQGERVVPRTIEDEMRDSYLDYSMSVIVQRALPDVRDGLKPVHRRILYGMNELGLTAGKPYKKSARIVGDVMGKYHPHGDSAIYDALVRMAQPFALRYPLVDGQGNFGSIDGDGAAAMRYTEARMEKITGELITDIDRETVRFVPNYDDSLKEPSVLPSRIPNLLVNGSSGIAVGMATNIPPHNLNEVVDALIALIDEPELTIDEIMGIIPGPDFPTGGIIFGMSGVREAYRHGRGRAVVRARAVMESPERGKDRIIITEIPFQVDKSRLIERIAQQVNAKKIIGISDIRDESDRDGMRLVIELKRDAIPEVVLNNLYAHSQLQTTFSVIMLALVDGQPKVISLKEALVHYLAHRHEIVVKRTEFDLRKARKREHILQGLKIAVDNLDKIIKIIRSSADTPTARKALMRNQQDVILEMAEFPNKTEYLPAFALSKIQADAILDMRLARLTGLERQKIYDELKAIKELIIQLEEILASRPIRMAIIRDELHEIRNQYGDERRTELIEETGEFSIEDMIAEEDMVISVTRAGYIKRFPVSGYRRQKRGGKGSSGHHPKDEDVVRHLFVASTHNYLLFFTNKGHCYWLKVHEVPSLGRTARGKPIVNLIDIGPDEKIAAMVNVPRFDDDKYIFFATRKGTIKKTALSNFRRPNRRGIIAIKITDDDALMGADITDGSCDIVLGSSSGKAVRFKEQQVRPMGRTAAGVIGIRLKDDAHVVGMVVMRREGTLLVCSEHGYGKRSSLEEYRLTNRGSQGVIAMKTTEKTGPIIAIMEVVDSDDLFIMTTSGIVIRQKITDIRTIGRVTQGVRLIRLHEHDAISDIAKVVRDEDDVVKMDDDEMLTVDENEVVKMDDDEIVTIDENEVEMMDD